ncbi:DUF2240 domain-containing protein [Halobacteriales archaeon QH_3_68_24]|nr:MAG: DUF2240 domain-containing protein [Halobacteriales archaeon QH_3_68_24]
MSLHRAVAEPFRAKGRETLTDSEFVVVLSLDREWFTAEQAKRLVDVATTEGLLERVDGDLTVTFDHREVAIPDGFTPDEDLLRQRSTFERALETLVEAGIEKQDAVASINSLQAELGVTVEAAAVVYARRQGVAIGDVAERARGEL